MVPKEAMPADYLGELDGYRPSLSTFIVWLGLNQDVRDKIDVCGFQVSSGRGPEADYQSCLKGEVEMIPFRISVYDNMFKGYSRPGSSTMRLFCLSGYGAWRKFEGDYRAGRKKAYYGEKGKWTDVLIRRAEEKAVPGLSSMIEVKEAATPLTNWRFTRNVEGAIYGFEQSMNNAYMDRIDNRTSLKGLYLASAWSYPGGGFSGVLLGGQITFQKMMEDWGG
jgi:prolycopene isomerase